MKLQFPPPALDGVKTGDSVTVELGMSASASSDTTKHENQVREAHMATDRSAIDDGHVSGPGVGGARLRVHEEPRVHRQGPEPSHVR